MYPRALWIAAAISLSQAAVYAETTGKNYAQSLLDSIVSRHPELAEMAVLARPQPNQDCVVIASNAARMGQTATADEMAVLTGGAQRAATAGDRYVVELPLLNAKNRVSGVLDLSFRLAAGTDPKPLLGQAQRIRDEIKGRVANRLQLFAAVGPDGLPVAGTQTADDEDSFILSNAVTALGSTAQDTPMSDENFTSTFQKATAAVTPEDSYKYTNGVNKTGTTGYDLNLRGFTTTASDRGAIITDGEPGATVRYGAAPNAALDHVEVIKGPASVLFGAGQPGGFVNVITKKPDDFYHSEISITGKFDPVEDIQGRTAGNRGGALGSIDVNSPLDDDKSLLGRAILYGVYQNGWRDFSYDHQFFFKPMLTWRPDASTSITMTVENREAQSDDYQGLVAPKYNVKLINRRPETSYQNPGDVIDEFGNAEVISADHGFDNGGSLHFDARNVHHADYSALFDNNHVYNDYQTLGRILIRKQNIRDYSFGNLYWKAPFETGFLGHEVTLGVSGGRDYLLTQRFQYLAGNNTALASESLSIYDPYGGKYNYQSALPYDQYALCGTGAKGTVSGNACNKSLFFQTTNQATVGLRASDMISITDQWKLLLAERYDGDFDHYHQNANVPIAGTNPGATYEQYYIHQFLPMVSGIYEPVKDRMMFYATYSTGFVPAGGNNQTIHGDPLTVPATARSEEIGTKMNLPDAGVRLTAALFNIQKEQTPVSVGCAPDAPPGTACFAASTTHSRGAELQADITLAPNWHTIAGYSLIDAHVVNSPDPVSDGARTSNTPRNALHLWTKYDIAAGPFAGLGFGLGEALIDWRAGSVPTTPSACSATNGDACWTNQVLKLPGYAVTDMAVYYKMGPVETTLKVGNLFNTNYYVAAFGGSNLKIITGEPTNILLTTRIGF